MEISNLIINKQRARENFFKELRLFLSLFSNIIANRERETNESLFNTLWDYHISKEEIFRRGERERKTVIK